MDYYLYNITYFREIEHPGVEKESGIVVGDSFSAAVHNIENDFGDTLESIEGLYPISIDTDTCASKDMIDCLLNNHLDVNMFTPKINTVKNDT